jgi:hypothetical protein
MFAQRISLRHCRVALICLLALLGPVGLAQTDDTAQEAPPAPDDEATLDSRLAALRSKVCEADPELCRDLKAFATANVPCLPQGERLAVGHARLIADDGSVTPAEYFVVRTQRVRDVTLVQSQHIYSENEEEKQAAEALIVSLKAGAADPDNQLFRYLQTRRTEVPELMAQRESRALVVRGEGPTLYLRQAGKLVYAAMPRGRFSSPRQEQARGEILFATLPAPASCQ